MLEAGNHDGDKSRGVLKTMLAHITTESLSEEVMHLAQQRLNGPGPSRSRSRYHTPKKKKKLDLERETSACPTCWDLSECRFHLKDLTLTMKTGC